MCPFSGLLQFFILLITLLLVCHAVVVNSFKVTFNPNATKIKMYEHAVVEYKIEPEGSSSEYILYSENPNVASLDKEYLISNMQGKFNISGNFLGKTVVSVRDRNSPKKIADGVNVTVVRKKRPIDIAFTASVVILISILYVNFGCAMNWGDFKGILKKPVGPAIGLFGHFFIMPLLSYSLGLLLFPNNHEMQLGLFFTGVSPAGGASNVWAVLLEGNLNLSVSMTAASTIAAFGFMPLWIFTLGRVIFQNAKLEVPYTHITEYVSALVIPLGIGYLIQRYFKNIAQFMTRIIKGFSSLLILFIIVFAIVTNLYLFKLFSWQIILAGMGIPWVGYLAGYLLAKLMGRNAADCLTIAIEVGTQNTGIAIFLLRMALPEPEGDLTTIAPVAVAVLTPFPLLFIYFVKKIRTRFYHSHMKLSTDENIKTDQNSNSHAKPAQLQIAP
ncbi:unnamed protein product [Phyllotreta striolata]|uniref:Uncharacterized protein n=1 Tax=Phyllotreta striolata TaxID=444603 RepID=A0A9P0DZI0_PHYSR|nr:unnamed protein product [Phyllotreta striolata]